VTLTLHWRYLIAIYLFVKWACIPIHFVMLMRLMCLQCSRATIWITCKKIGACSFLATTTFGAEYCLPLIFWPKLTHPAACFLCDSGATCRHSEREQPQIILVDKCSFVYVLVVFCHLIFSEMVIRYTVCYISLFIRMAHLCGRRTFRATYLEHFFMDTSFHRFLEVFWQRDMVQSGCWQRLCACQLSVLYSHLLLLDSVSYYSLYCAFAVA